MPPKGGVESEKLPGSNYGCIHNTLNQNDLITYVGPGEMGFIRYGIDHFIPGEPTDEASNRPYDVNRWEYCAYAYKMRVHAAAIAPELVFDDYFHPATINYVTGAALSSFGWKMIAETNDKNWHTEDFIPLFMEKLQEYALYYGANYRDAYARTSIANGRTFEQAASLMVGLAFGKSADEIAGITASLGSLMERLDMTTLAKAYLGVRKNDSPLPHFSDKDMEIIGSSAFRSVCASVWNKLTVLSDDDRAAGCHAISEYLTEQELGELESCFSALMLPIIELVTRDYKDYADLENLSFSAYTEPILLNQYDKPLYITAYASKDGFRNSDPITWTYTLTIPEVTALDAKPASIAEDGNVSCVYSVKTVEYYDKETGEVVNTETGRRGLHRTSQLQRERGRARVRPFPLRRDVGGGRKPRGPRSQRGNRLQGPRLHRRPGGFGFHRSAGRDGGGFPYPP